MKVIHRLVGFYRGLHTPPVVTAMIRATTEIIAFALFYLVYNALPLLDLPSWTIQYVPFVLMASRPLEGLIDQIDPAKKRARDPNARSILDVDVDEGRVG